MIVRKSFHFRLKPTKKQAGELDRQLQECCWLYNQLLEQRKLAYEELAFSLTKYQQLMFLPELKLERPGLNNVHSQVLQNVVDRLDKAFEGFFRRCKAGCNPGFPRFRNVHRYASFCYPQSGFALTCDGLKLSKIGTIRIKMHRPIEGRIKTCTLRKNAAGDWNVSLSCEIEVQPLPHNDKAIGIDVGLENFATFSDGAQIANPRFFKQAEKALAKGQRQLAKLKKGTRKRHKKGKAVAKIYEKMSNRRKDFCHKESRKIVDEYQYICIEDLEVKNMIEKSCFAKNILDASWNQFSQFLAYKAAEAGRKLGLVNPAYTTQTCSKCGYREAKKLSDRQHCCARCAYTVSRDFNAAQNILALGLDGLGANPRSLRL